MTIKIAYPPNVQTHPPVVTLTNLEEVGTAASKIHDFGIRMRHGRNYTKREGRDNVLLLYIVDRYTRSRDYFYGEETCFYAVCFSNHHSGKSYTSHAGFAYLSVSCFFFLDRENSVSKQTVKFENRADIAF